jgi:hypothetical protein
MASIEATSARMVNPTKLTAEKDRPRSLTIQAATVRTPPIVFSSRPASAGEQHDGQDKKRPRHH